MEGCSAYFQRLCVLYYVCIILFWKESLRPLTIFPSHWSVPVLKKIPPSVCRSESQSVSVIFSLKTCTNVTVVPTWHGNTAPISHCTSRRVRLRVTCCTVNRLPITHTCLYKVVCLYKPQFLRVSWYCFHLDSMSVTHVHIFVDSW